MREIDPKLTSRAKGFSMWLNAPMPMVTVNQTLDITAAVRRSRRRDESLNALLCWCIGQAASGVEEFYLLVKGEKLLQYDKLAINLIVKTQDGLCNCDVPWSENRDLFLQDYERLTRQVVQNQQDFELGDDYNIIGTSALVKYEVDSVANLYSGIFTNPFLMWGKYRKKWLRYKLPVSFQFHHSQMDGGEACEFLARWQQAMNNLK